MEKRKSGPAGAIYYSVRGRKGPRRLYFSGPVAELLEAFRARQRCAQQLQQRAGEQIRQQLDCVVPLLTELEEWTDLLVALRLLLTGHHRPNRGPWRRRCKAERSSSEPTSGTLG